MKEELTSKQEKILAFITHYIEDKGYPPTFREIGQFFGLASTNAVEKFINILEEKGYIRRSAKSARAMEVIDHTRKQRGILVPIVGRITAGEPILAIENIEDKLLLDPSFTRKKNSFLLRVQGDSMIEVGIYDQDLALIRPQKTAENGEIVAVLVDDEATIKKFYRKKVKIILKPANTKYEPIVVKRGEEVKIIGKVIGIIRRYNYREL